jgi:hypothetical protein
LSSGVLDTHPDLTAIDRQNGRFELMALVHAVAQPAGVWPSEPTRNPPGLEHLDDQLAIHRRDCNGEDLTNRQRGNDCRLRAGQLGVEPEFVAR